MFGLEAKDPRKEIERLNEEHDNRVTCLLKSANAELERRRYAEHTIQLIKELIEEGKGVDAISTLILIRSHQPGRKPGS